MKSEFPGDKECLIGPLNGFMTGNRFAQLCLDIADCMIIVLNKDQTTVFVNKKCCDILDYKTEEMIGRNWFDAFVPDCCREETKAAFDTLVSGGVVEIEHYENPITTRAGDERIIVWHNMALRDEAGSIFAALSSGEDITERRKAEAALQESEEKFRIIFETSRDAIMLLDRQGFFDCNQACLDIYGCTSKEQFVSKHPGEWSPPRQADGSDSLAAARERIEKALAEGTHAFEWNHKRLDGTVFPAEVLLSRSEFGGKTILQAVVRDITERKLAQERLRQSEEKYRNMFDNAIEGMYQSTPDGHILNVNRAQASIFGYASPREMIEDIKNLDRDIYVRPEDRGKYKEILERQGFVEGFEVENFTRNGEKIWIALNTWVVQDKEGHTLYYEGITENITQKKMAAHALQESERRLTEITEFLPDPMFVIDLEGRILFWNRAMADLTGVSAKEMVGKGNREYALPFYQERRPLLIDFVLNPEDLAQYYSAFTREGDTCWAETDYLVRGRRCVLSGKAKPLYDSNGSVIGAIESIRDITERKLMEEEIRQMNAELQQMVAERTAELVQANRALAEDIDRRIHIEEAIRESERKYREMAELLPGTIFECDETGRLLFVNSQYYEKFGYGAGELAEGLTIYQMLVPEDRQRAMDNVQLVLNGELRSGIEYMALRKDGVTFPILVNSTSIEQKGRHIGIRGFAVDISEHKKMAEELLKVQKLESVGILAGGIAHDFNNLLAAVIGYIDLARISSPMDKSYVQNLERARKASLQASELTKRLITFSLGGEPHCKAIALSNIIKVSCDHFLQKTGIVCRTALMEGLWPVLADEGQLQQVANHLLMNAGEAMPQGGTVDICAENSLVDEGANLPLASGAYVKWSIRDSGQGIPPENLTRIFDPYFTTKDRGSEKGMGLGLAICYSVVKRHNGLILVESEPGSGSSFHIYLPVAVTPDMTSDSAVKSDGLISAEAATPEGKILVMDDEEYILELMCDMLHVLGYTVETARDGNEAVDIYLQALANKQPFSVAILDLEIPGGRGGLFVMERLQEVDPGVKAIVVSGFSNDPILNRHGSYGFKGAVTKPFTIKSLSRILREVIGEKRTQIMPE